MALVRDDGRTLLHEPPKGTDEMSIVRKMTEEADDLVQAVVNALHKAGYHTVTDPADDGYGANVAIKESNSEVEFLTIDISNEHGTTLRVHHDGQVHRIHSDGRAASDVRRVISRLISGIDAIANLPSMTLETGLDAQNERLVGDPIPSSVASTLVWVLIENLQSVAENFQGYPTDKAKEAIDHINTLLEAGAFLKEQVTEGEAIELHTQLDRIIRVRQNLQADLDQSARPARPAFTR